MAGIVARPKQRTSGGARPDDHRSSAMDWGGPEGRLGGGCSRQVEGRRSRPARRERLEGWRLLVAWSRGDVLRLNDAIATCALVDGVDAKGHALEVRGAGQRIAAVDGRSVARAEGRVAGGRGRALGSVERRVRVVA